MQDEGLELDLVDHEALDVEAFDADSHDGDAPDVEALEASDLGGPGEHSATEGGSQPAHPSRDADADEPDADALREMYRYSLGRATQDASPGRLERWMKGALHEEDPTRVG